MFFLLWQSTNPDDLSRLHKYHYNVHDIQLSDEKLLLLNFFMNISLQPICHLIRKLTRSFVVYSVSVCRLPSNSLASLCGTKNWFCHWKTHMARPFCMHTRICIYIYICIYISFDTRWLSLNHANICRCLPVTRWSYEPHKFTKKTVYFQTIH